MEMIIWLSSLSDSWNDYILLPSLGISRLSYIVLGVGCWTCPMLECGALLAWNRDTWQSRPTALCYRGNLGDFRWLCHGCILLMDYWQVIKRGSEASFRGIKLRYAAIIYMRTVYCYICCCSLALEVMFQTSIIWMKLLNNRLLLCLLRCTAVCGPADAVMLHVLLRCQLFIRNTVNLITKHNTTW